MVAGRFFKKKSFYQLRVKLLLVGFSGQVLGLDPIECFHLKTLFEKKNGLYFFQFPILFGFGCLHGFLLFLVNIPNWLFNLVSKTFILTVLDEGFLFLGFLKTSF